MKISELLPLLDGHPDVEVRYALDSGHTLKQHVGVKTVQPGAAGMVLVMDGRPARSGVLSRQLKFALETDMTGLDGKPVRATVETEIYLTSVANRFDHEFETRANAGLAPEALLTNAAIGADGIVLSA